MPDVAGGTNLKQFIEAVRARLAGGAYASEAAVSLGIVMPALRLLGWDDSNPDEVIPEHTSGRGRVDFALTGAGRKPAVFIEVKGVGRSVEGDRQLFEYAFHEGVPLCLLTDGRDWSFYLPGGQGSYDDRRVYRLLIDERPPAECARVLHRYLARDRVRSGAAYEDAQRDYRDAAQRREAAGALPRAWGELLADGDDLLVEMLADRAEAACGIRPAAAEVAAFLRAQSGPAPAEPHARSNSRGMDRAPPASAPAAPPVKRVTVASATRLPPTVPGAGDSPIVTAAAGRAIEYRLFGTTRRAATAAEALVEILRAIVARDPARLSALAAAVRGRSRNHIAPSVAEIYPARPDLARAIEIAPGWLVGLNIANRDKRRILLAACDVFRLTWGVDLVLDLPNA